MFAACLRDQREFCRAAGLLESLASYYGRIGNQEALSRTLLSRAIVASHDNDPEEAIRWLRLVVRLTPPESNLRLSVIHELTSCLVEAGYPREAEAVIKKYE